MKKRLLSMAAFLFASSSLVFSQVTYVDEDFENGMPSGWTQSTFATDGGWNVGTAASMSSTYFPIVDHTSIIATNDDGCNCDKSADTLFTDSIDLSGAGSSVMLKFDMYYFGGSYNGIYENFDVYIHSANNNSMSMVYDAPVATVADWADDIVIDISSYVGDQIVVAFVYNDGGDWLYGAALDNVSVFEPAAFDAALTAVSTEKYQVDGSAVDITGTITNNGANTITSIDVNWSDGTNTFTETMSVNIASFTSADFTHADAFNVPSAGEHNISVWVDLANDANSANDQIDIDVIGVSYFPTRIVVGEEATGTWCGWCPRGHVWMEYMADNYPDRWIGIAVHNSDPMENSDYDSWMATQIGGYPSGVINREFETDPSTFETAFESVMDDFAFADIEVEAVMEVNRTLNVDVSAEFAADVNEDLRFAAVVIEDEVTGTSSDWAQVNYYSGGGSGNLSGAGHDWHDAPDPVPAADMVYEDVGRELLGGINGDAGSVPSSIAAGDIVTHDFTHSLSTDYNEAHIRVAVLLIDQATGEILNAAQAHMSYKIELNGAEVWIVDGDSSVAFNGDWVPIDEMTLWDGEWTPLGVTVVDGDMISVYPNPVVNQLNIEGVEGITNVTVFDMTGRMVMNVNTETNTVDVSDLQSGSYNLVIENKGMVANKRVQIVH